MGAADVEADHGHDLVLVAHDEPRPPVDGVRDHRRVRAPGEQGEQSAGDLQMAVDRSGQGPHLPAAVEEGGDVGCQQGRQPAAVLDGTRFTNRADHEVVLPGRCGTGPSGAQAVPGPLGEFGALPFGLSHDVGDCSGRHTEHVVEDEGCPLGR